MSRSPAIIVQGVHKTYKLGRQELHVLQNVDCQVEQGEFVSIVGASGSGKSTLLHLVGLLDRSDEGHIALSGQDVSELSFRARNRIRCHDIGFVFQFYHLFSELTVLGNAMLPAMVDTPLLQWMSKRKHYREKATAVLEEVGLADRLKHRPRELSGGERQRVAIARALMNEPDILLADEPTGNLDSKTGAKIMKLLNRYNEKGQTILMVTHDSKIAAQTDRVMHLVDGRMAGDGS
ncbi:MAG: ABC transporter ATP-binding protein [Phycisphaerales bacterium]|jgi:lipoprotein-releasing system ATP-binding protein|nr:ABC transporter ATP-binding protein [Phycisphaerales bacterium]